MNSKSGLKSSKNEISSLDFQRPIFQIIARAQYIGMLLWRLILLNAASPWSGVSATGSSCSTSCPEGVPFSKFLISDFYVKNNITDENYHGGLWETALNWAVNPEYFRPEYLDETKYPQHYGALKENHFEGSIRPCKSEYAKFTPEFAKKMHNTTVRRLADEVLNIYKSLK